MIVNLSSRSVFNPRGQDSPHIQHRRSVVDGSIDLRVQHGGVAVVLRRVRHACVPHHGVKKVSR